MANIFSMNDIRGRTDDSLTAEYAWNIGKAFAEWLQSDGLVLVAKTPNAHEQTAHAVIEGVLLQGRDVRVLEQADRQAVLAGLAEGQAAGGICVSHDDAGGLEVIELFNAQGGTITADSGLMELSALCEAANFDPAPQKGTVQSN